MRVSPPRKYGAQGGSAIMRASSFEHCIRAQTHPHFRCRRRRPDGRDLARPPRPAAGDRRTGSGCPCRWLHHFAIASVLSLRRGARSVARDPPTWRRYNCFKLSARGRSAVARTGLPSFVRRRRRAADHARRFAADPVWPCARSGRAPFWHSHHRHRHRHSQRQRGCCNVRRPPRDF